MLYNVSQNSIICADQHTQFQVCVGYENYETAVYLWCDFVSQCFQLQIIQKQPRKRLLVESVLSQNFLCVTRQKTSHDKNVTVFGQSVNCTDPYMRCSVKAYNLFFTVFEFLLEKLKLEKGTSFYIFLLLQGYNSSQNVTKRYNFYICSIKLQLVKFIRIMNVKCICKQSIERQDVRYIPQKHNFTKLITAALHFILALVSSICCEQQFLRQVVRGWRNWISRSSLFIMLAFFSNLFVIHSLLLLSFFFSHQFFMVKLV